MTLWMVSVVAVESFHSEVSRAQRMWEPSSWLNLDDWVSRCRSVLKGKNVSNIPGKQVVMI